MIKKLFFPLVLVLATAQLSHAAGYSNTAPIFQFQYYKAHIGLMVRQQAMLNPDACERSDWYILPKDHLYYKEMVALIMSSHLVDQPLQLGLEGCAQGMPAIQHVLSTK